MIGFGSSPVPSEIIIHPINESKIKIQCDYGPGRELQDYFTFIVPNSQYRQPGKRKPGTKFPVFKWNGKTSLFKLKTMELYRGLIPYVEEFAKDHNYTVTMSDPSLTKMNPITSDELQEFINNLNLRNGGKSIAPYDYQFNSVLKALQHKRLLIISPTASGKSLVIYLLLRSLLHITDRKILVIVPTTNLVRQLFGDFIDYSSHNGFAVENNVSKIYANQDKNARQKIYISTWQSMVNMDPEYLAQFGAVIADECLDGNTKIKMGNNTEKMIKDIKIGDIVKTYNETTKQIENKPVVNIYENNSIKEEMFEITLENKKTLKITGNHKILLTTGVWKRVDEIKEGDIINSI